MRRRQPERDFAVPLVVGFRCRCRYRWIRVLRHWQFRSHRRHFCWWKTRVSGNSNPYAFLSLLLRSASLRQEIDFFHEKQQKLEKVTDFGCDDSFSSGDFIYKNDSDDFTLRVSRKLLLIPQAPANCSFCFFSFFFNILYSRAAIIGSFSRFFTF